MGAVGFKDQGENGGGCWGRLGPGVGDCGGSVGWH